LSPISAGDIHDRQIADFHQQQLAEILLGIVEFDKTSSL
jgi:hypothetical protein